MKHIKVLLIIFLIGGAFYVGVIGAITTLVSGSNEGFISLLPFEAVAVVLVIIFAIIMGLIYSLFNHS